MAKRSSPHHSDATDLAISRTMAGTRKFVAFCDVLKLALRCGVAVIALWMCRDTILGLATANVPAIEAISNLVKALRLDTIVMGVSSLVSGTAWYFERRAKKRAIRKLGETRHQKENGDPERSSSKLTPEGDTPRD